MGKTYRIVVTEEEEVDVSEQKWQKHYDTPEQAKAAGREDGSMYAYATRKDRKLRSTQVFEQLVTDLDLSTVVKAVNKIQESKPDGKPSKTKA